MKVSKKLIVGASVALTLFIGIIILSLNMPGAEEITASGNEIIELANGENESAGNEAADSAVLPESSGSGDSSEQNEPDDDSSEGNNETDTSQNTGDSQSADTGENVTESTSENEADTSQTTVAPPVAETGTPVENHGELAVRGTSLVDEHGNPYQLQGVSTHGIGWFPDYVNKAGFQTMRDEWGINCVRLAMYTWEYNGYCSGGNQAQLKQLVNDGVSYATELGLYVIIDWHVLQDLDPNNNTQAAIAFFDEMSERYADYDNVIYEICNEPNGGVSWASIKQYAMQVIPVIKANNPDAVIIVGTPNWSQDVDIASNDPITGYTNIMYAIHFYAETHRDSLRQKMQTAINNGLPIFCSEFGICDASGNGTINTTEANNWIAAMDANNISYCIWNLSNKAESSSLIQSGCNLTSGWSESDLSESGRWYVGVLNNGVPLGSTSSGGNSGNSSASSSASGSGGNSGGGSNSSSGGGNQSSQAVSASAANTQVSVANSGSWSSGSGNCYQYTVTVKNTGSSTIQNWNITLNFGSNVSLDQSWNGNFALSGSSLTITPVDFNSQIGAGQSVEVGFIIETSGSVGTPSVSIN